MTMMIMARRRIGGELWINVYKGIIRTLLKLFLFGLDSNINKSCDSNLSNSMFICGIQFILLFSNR